MQTIYEAVGGREGLLKLAAAWHVRVLADEVVSHAFSHGYHPQHTERLAAYWAEALGGPNTYSEKYGNETSVVRIHSGNGEHGEMDQRAIACFDQALEDVGVPRDDRLWRALHDYFAWATNTTMARYHRSADDVPDGLRIPKWSWNGLVTTPGAGGHRWYARPVLFVSDLNRALPFYLDQLGFRKNWHSDDGKGTVCQVSRSDCEIILCQDAARHDRSRLFIELTAEGLEDFRRELSERSVPNQLIRWGYDATQVIDPDGNELLFPKPD